MADSKKLRKQHRALLTNRLNEVNEILASEMLTDEQIQRLNELSISIEDEHLILTQISDELSSTAEQDEVIKTSDYSCKSKACLKRIKARLEPPQPAGTPLMDMSLGSPDERPIASKVRLPKLDLPRFRGSITEWNPFFQRFKSCIHDDPTLSTIDKFQYLLDCLEGEAERLVKGLSITEANYADALSSLKNRYGDRDCTVAAHVNNIYNAKSCQRGSDHNGLRELYDILQCNIRSLRNLSEDTNTVFLVPVIMAKLPEFLRLKISRDYHSKITVSNILSAMRSEVEAKIRSAEFSVFGTEDLGKSPPHNNNRSRGYHNRVNHSRGSRQHVMLTQAQEPGIYCVFCKASGQHTSAKCKSVSNPNDRVNMLMKERRCFMCLNTGHISRFCFKALKCFKCSGRHNVAIHGADMLGGSEKPSYKPAPVVSCNTIESCVTGKKPLSKLDMKSNERNEEKDSPSSSGLICSAQAFAAPCLMQTAVAEIRNPRDKSLHCKARILFDSASSSSYVSGDLCKRLSLSSSGSRIMDLSTFGGGHISGQKFDVVNFCLSKSGQRYPELNITGGVMPQNRRICDYSPSVIDLSIFPHLRDLELADDFTAQSNGQIDVLIGIDFYHQILSGQVVRGDKCNIVAVNSLLGWVISGTYQDNKALCRGNSCVVPVKSQTVSMFCQSNENSVSDDMIASFWDTESIGISTNENQIYEDFVNDIEYRDGRYNVSLPWKGNLKSGLDSNFQLSKRRLFSVLQRLKSSSEKFSVYNEIIETQQTTGIIESCTIDGSDEHFIPHHAVFRKDKDTTKTRIVYDGSAKPNSNALSINDCLHAGPDLLLTLFSVLVRFRFYPIALTADIEKAFHMISVRETDRPFLKFLWIDDDNRLSSYQFARVPFGLNCSPFLLNATLKLHLSRTADKFPQTSKLIETSMYVDDLICGSYTQADAKTVINDSTEIMKLAGMNLRKWSSNRPEIFDAYDSVHCHNEPTVSVLGLNWNKEGDTLALNIQRLLDKPITGRVTKRAVLKYTSMIFDPLGLFIPFTVGAKILFQDICKLGIEWDVKLDTTLSEQWDFWISELSRISTFVIPRCIMTQGEPERLELHGFCDGSKRAYCGVIFVRAIYSGGSFCRILCAKSRIAPVKPQSIPRVELLGALILSRLMSNVVSLCKIENIFLWTDSQIVLAWISKVRGWKQYVQNRVDEIVQHFPHDFWRYVPTDENPADLGTRGINASALAESKLWWEGPHWLNDPSTDIADKLCKPSDVSHISDADLEIKVRETKVCVSVSKSKFLSSFFIRFSSLQRAIRVFALVNRFIYNIRNRGGMCGGDLTVEEVNRAELLLVRLIQADSFSDELKTLKEGNIIPVKFRQLRVFLDETGILRSQTRIECQAVSIETSSPMLLPADNIFTRLVILNAHERVFHAKVSSTLNLLRQRWWIIRGRQIVKSTISSCVLCKLFDSQPYPTPIHPPNLPEFRLRSKFVFCVVGVDFFGPTYVRENRVLSKGYVCLFTCASTRAVHLEYVNSVSAEAFLGALRRFVARRGCPESFVSDNAATFRQMGGFFKEVANVLQRSNIEKFTLNNRINWHYITQKAPWMGGFYERLIRTVKNALKRTLGRSRVSQIQLITLLSEIEAAVNSRPLTPYIYDSENIQPLTPAHFLVGRPLLSLPGSRNEPSSDIRLSASATDLKRQFHIQSKLTNFFWKIWTTDYLTSLKEQHSKALTKDKISSKWKPAVGDVVLIKDTSHPRLYWRLGIVENLLIGTDDVVRSAQIRCDSNTHLTRSITHLYPLEINTMTNDAQPKSSTSNQEDEINYLSSEDDETESDPEMSSDDDFIAHVKSPESLRRSSRLNKQT